MNFVRPIIRESSLSAILIAVALLIAASAIASQTFAEQNTSPRSSEVGFSSLSPNGAAGGRIIPASCESGYTHYPDQCLAMPADACTSGAQIISGDSGAAVSGNRYGVTKFGGAYCFENSGGPSYLIPAKTQLEFTYFYDAISRLLGLSKIKACSYKDNCPGTVVACRYSAPDASGVIAINSSQPVFFGPWSNDSCGTSGTGWYSRISTCSTGVGNGYAKCNWVIVRE